MPRFIVKPDPAEDFYVYWSTIVDDVIACGSRAELSGWLIEAGDTGRVAQSARFERADRTGSSSVFGAYGWAVELFNLGQYSEPRYVKRENLAAYVRALMSGGRDAAIVHTVPVSEPAEFRSRFQPPADAPPAMDGRTPEVLHENGGSLADYASRAPARYRKKPVEIEAMEYGPTSADARTLTCWLESYGYAGLVGNALEPATLRHPDQADGDDSTPDKGWYIDPADGALMIRTLEGDMRVSPGDYVIRGVQGEFYPCGVDIFLATYDASRAHDPAEPCRPATVDETAGDAEIAAAVASINESFAEMNRTFAAVGENLKAAIEAARRAEEAT